MSQSRAWSLVESWANVAVGFGVNWIANLLVLPWFGFAISGRQAALMGCVFTVISVTRSYALRRAFNRW
jgi:hypothetical protein